MSASAGTGSPQRGANGLSMAVLAVFGLMLVLYGLSSVIGPRVHYQGSEPSPGATRPSPPKAVTVWFNGVIDSTSRLWVEVMHAVDGSAGTHGRLLATARGPDPLNPLATSLRAALPDSARPGYYVVRWETRSRGGQRLYGALMFGVGAELPQAVDGRVVERIITPRRGGWPAIFGGVVSIMISLWMWRTQRQSPEIEPGPDPDPPGTWGEPPST
jgi:methionine-rich copper-binding protein CopC